MRKRHLLAASLAAGFCFAGCTQDPAQVEENQEASTAESAATQIDGTWSAQFDDGEEYLLEIKRGQGRLTGFVTPPSGGRLPISDGVIDGDAFEFSTRQGEDVWIWEGEVMDDSLDGNRRSVDDDDRLPFTAEPVDAPDPE